MQFFKRDSHSLEAAKGVSNKTFNPRIKYYDVTYCIRGGKNFKPRGRKEGNQVYIYLSVYLGGRCIGIVGSICCIVVG